MVDSVTLSPNNSASSVDAAVPILETHNLPPLPRITFLIVRRWLNNIGEREPCPCHPLGLCRSKQISRTAMSWTLAERERRSHSGEDFTCLVLIGTVLICNGAARLSPLRTHLICDWLPTLTAALRNIMVRPRVAQVRLKMLRSSDLSAHGLASAGVHQWNIHVAAAPRTSRGYSVLG